MADKVLKTRIKNKYDTAANWAKATTFVPLAGEICVYDNGAGKEPQIKIGDGKTTVVNLPFVKDNNTTYGTMKGATSSAAGSSGLVPTPAAGAQGKFLRGDGTWQTPTNTDTKVTQTNSSTNAAYRILLSANANDTTETNTSFKSAKFTANPSTGNFSATSITVGSHVTLQYDATNECLNFAFV